MSRSHKHIRIDSLALCVAAGLLGLQQAAPAPAAARPDWLQRRPVSTEFIIGIGAARVDEPSSSPAYNRALTLALRDISTQLKVNVSASASMRVVENRMGISEEFSGDTQVRAAAELEGTEIVDTWIGADTCWVYVRLNGSEYHESRRQRLADVQRYLADALRQLRQAMPAVALAAGLRALELARELPDHRQATGDAAAGLRERLSELRMRSRPVENAESEVAVVVDSRCLGNDDCPAAGDSAAAGTAADREPAYYRGLPIRWTFTDGTGELPPLSWTDENGRATTRISRVRSTRGEPAVAAFLDLATLRPATAYRYTETISQLPAPSIRIILPRPRLTAMLAWEVDGDIDVDIAACARSVARDLAAHGIDVVASGESQLRVDLAVDVRNLNTVGTLTFAFLDLSVHVWNDAGSLSRIHALGLKGAGPTTAEAVRAAFLKSTDHLHEAAADARRRLLIPSPHPNGGQLSAPSHELTSRVNRRTEP